MSDNSDSFVEHLKEVIQELLNISGTTQNKIFQDSDIVALRLCYIIEKVASHGLMDRGVFSKTTIWDYVQNLGKCLPGGQSAVDKASKEAKTPIGKGRVFIRVSLNECSLADYMSSLIWNESLTRKFYHPSSIFVSEEHKQTIIMLFENLNNVKFKLNLKDDSLNDLKLWSFNPEITRRNKISKIIKNSNENSAPSTPIDTSESNDNAMLLQLKEEIENQRKQREEEKLIEEESKKSEIERLESLMKSQLERERLLREEEQSKLEKLLQQQLEIDRKKLEEKLEKEKQESEENNRRLLELQKLEIEQQRKQLDEERLLFNKQMELLNEKTLQNSPSRPDEIIQSNEIKSIEDKKEEQKDLFDQKENDVQKEVDQIIIIEDNEQEKIEIEEKNSHSNYESFGDLGGDDDSDNDVISDADVDINDNNHHSDGNGSDENVANENTSISEEIICENKIDEINIEDNSDGDMKDDLDGVKINESESEIVVNHEEIVEHKDDEVEIHVEEKITPIEEVIEPVYVDELKEEKVDENNDKVEEIKEIKVTEEKEVEEINERIIQEKKEENNNIEREFVTKEDEIISQTNDQVTEDKMTITGQKLVLEVTRYPSPSDQRIDEIIENKPQLETNNIINTNKNNNNNNNNNNNDDNNNNDNNNIYNDKEEQKPVQTQPQPPIQSQSQVQQQPQPQPQPQTNSSSASSWLNKVNLIKGVKSRIDAITDKDYERISIEDIYTKILTRLSDSIKSVIKEGLKNILYSDNIVVTELCASLESVFMHGLIDKNIIRSSTTYWDYVKNIKTTWVSGEEVITKIMKIPEISSDIGRARCFLRIALNEKRLLEYFTSLTSNEEITKKNYLAKALLREEEQVTIVKNFLRSIGDVRFSLSLIEERLNSADCWELLRKESRMNEKKQNLLASLEQHHQSEENLQVAVAPVKKVKRKKKRKTKITKTADIDETDESDLPSSSSSSSRQREEKKIDIKKEEIIYKENNNNEFLDEEIEIIDHTLSISPEKTNEMNKVEITQKKDVKNEEITKNNEIIIEKTIEKEEKEFKIQLSYDIILSDEENEKKSISQPLSFLPLSQPSQNIDKNFNSIADDQILIENILEGNQYLQQLYQITLPRENLEISRSFDDTDLDDDLNNSKEIEENLFLSNLIEDSSVPPTPASSFINPSPLDDPRTVNPNQLIDLLGNLANNSSSMGMNIPIDKSNEYTSISNQASYTESYLSSSYLSEEVVTVYGDRYNYFLLIVDDKLRKFSLENEQENEKFISPTFNNNFGGSDEEILNTSSEWFAISDQIARDQKDKMKQIENFSFKTPQDPEDLRPAEDVLVMKIHTQSKKVPPYCASCPNSLKGISPRFCHYTGKFYCRTCHVKDLSFIPSLIIFKWDFKNLPICVYAKSHIRANYQKPILDILQLNPSVYQLPNSNLPNVLIYRRILYGMKNFIYSCRSKERLLSILGSRSYMLDSIHKYSLSDLVLHYSNGSSKSKLIEWLREMLKKLKTHIEEDCQTCKGKGNYCEICKKNQLIFSYQLNRVIQCKICNAIFHRECFSPTTLIPCPKCVRIEQIKSKSTKSK